MKFLQHFEQVYVVVVVVSLFYLWSVCTAFVVVVPSRSIRSSRSSSSSTPVTKSHGLQYEYSKQQQRQHSRRLSLLYLQASNNNNNNNIDENNDNNDDNDDNNKNDNMIFFDDFADMDFLGGSDTNEDLPPPPQTSPILSSQQQEQKQQQEDSNSLFLTDRIQTLQQQEMQQQAVLLQNWKLGNWQVRGFSLEPELENNNKDDDEDEQPPKDLTPEEFMAQRQEKARAAAAKKGQQQAKEAAATAAMLFGQTPTSLEPPKNDDNDKKNNNDDAVSVCRIVADATDFMEQDNCIWVGRTDGSIYYIQLGTDYWTAFRSTTGEEQQDTTTTSSFLQQETVLEYFKDDNEDDENDDDDDDDDDNSSSSIPKLPLKQKTTKPFEIKGSIQAGDGAVTAIAAVTVTDIDGDFSSHLLYTATANGNGMMQQWLVQESDDDDDDNNNNNNNHNKNAPKIIPTVQLTGGAHTTAPFFMKALSLDTDDVDNDEPTILLSVDESAIALWDIATGDLLYQCQIASASTSDNYDDANDYDGTTGSSSSSTSSPKITSADSNGIHIYLGTTSGQVLAYSITDLLSSAAIAGPTATCPLPSGQWQASSTDGGASAVTSVACGGEGTLGRGRNQPTYILFTGNEDGTVKQWEVLQVNNNRLEQWPKLSTQRLPKKAHLFPGSPDQPAVSAIVSLQGMPNMLSAYTDGTIRAWNTGTGKELFRMEGFVSSSSSRSDSSSSSSSNGGGGVNSLCVLERGNLLVTDGMGKFVCVHDFKQAHDDDVDDFELDMPEYRD